MHQRNLITHNSDARTQIGFNFIPLSGWTRTQLLPGAEINAVCRIDGETLEKKDGPTLLLITRAQLDNFYCVTT